MDIRAKDAKEVAGGFTRLRSHVALHQFTVNQLEAVAIFHLQQLFRGGFCTGFGGCDILFFQGMAAHEFLLFCFLVR